MFDVQTDDNIKWWNPWKIGQNKQWDFKNLKNSSGNLRETLRPEKKYFHFQVKSNKSLLHSYHKVNNSPFYTFSLVWHLEVVKKKKKSSAPHIPAIFYRVYVAIALHSRLMVFFFFFFLGHLCLAVWCSAETHFKLQQ